MAYQNNHKRYQVDIGFNVDPKGIKLLQQELKKLEFLKDSDYSKLFGSTSGKYKEEAKKMRIYASEVRMALQAAYNPKLKTTNIEKFNRIIKQSGLNLLELSKYFSNVGITGQNVSTLLTNSMTKFNVKIKENYKLLDKIGKTLANTLKWNLSATLINKVSGSIQQAWGFTKNLQQSLTDIRIVTGKSAAEMSKFAKEANKAAFQLGRTTTDYTKAALIYAQQGLNDTEIKKRSEITLKTANVTDQSAETVSEELTAVWNGYKASAEEAEVYIDRLAAVASTTASNLSELSIGMSKVAAAAASLGVGEDQLAAQLSTIISVTRQAPETVGTALKTIYSRITDIQAGIDEDGTTLGTYSGKLAELGIKVLDSSGKLRNMGQVMEEIGSKWGTFSKEQQIYIAQTMAGQRQYTNLIALFDNYQDKYISALKTARGAEGTLSKQNKAYMEDINTKITQLTTATENMWMNLIDTKGFKGVINDLTTIINKVDQLFQSIGGGKAVLNTVGSIAIQLMSKTMASNINTFINNRIQSKNQKASLKQSQTHIQDKLAILEAQGKGDSAEAKALRDKARFLPNIQYFSHQSISKINQLWDQSANAGVQADIAKKRKEKKFDPLKKFTGIKETDESDLQGIQANIEAANKVFKTDQDAVTQIIENSASNISQAWTEEIKTATVALKSATTNKDNAVENFKKVQEKKEKYEDKKNKKDAAEQAYNELNEKNQKIKADNQKKSEALIQKIDDKAQQIQKLMEQKEDMMSYEGGGYRLRENITKQDYGNLEAEILTLIQEKNQLFDQLFNLPDSIDLEVKRAREAFQKAQDAFNEEQANNQALEADVENAEKKVKEEEQKVNQAKREQIKAIGESRLKAFNNSLSGTVTDEKGKEQDYDLMKYIEAGRDQNASEELKGFAKQYDTLTEKIKNSGKATTDELKELNTEIQNFFNNLGEYAKQSAGNLESEGQVAMEALQKYRQALNKVRQAEEEAKSGMRQVVIQGILQVTGAIGELQSSMQILQNMGNIWSNDDLEMSEKIFQTFSNIGTTIFTTIDGIRSLKDGLGKINLEFLQSQENDQEDNSGSGIRNKIKNKLKEFGTTLTSEIPTGKGGKIAFGAAAGIAGAAIAGMQLWGSKMEESREAAIEANNEVIESEQTLQNKIANEKSIIAEVEALNQSFKDGNISRQELKTKTEELRVKYKNQSDTIKELVSDYTNLGEAIEKASEKTTREEIKSRQRAAKAEKNNLMQGLNSTHVGTGLDLGTEQIAKLSGSMSIGTNGDISSQAMQETAQLRQFMESQGFGAGVGSNTTTLLFHADTGEEAIKLVKALQQFKDTIGPSSALAESIDKIIEQNQDAVDAAQANDKSVGQDIAVDALKRAENELSSAKNYSEYKTTKDSIESTARTLLKNNGYENANEKQITEAIKTAMAQAYGSNKNYQQYDETAELEKTYNSLFKEELPDSISSLISTFTQDQLAEAKSLNFDYIDDYEQLEQILEKIAKKDYSGVEKFANTSFTKIGEQNSAWQSLYNTVSKNNNISSSDYNKFKKTFVDAGIYSSEQEFKTQWEKYFTMDPYGNYSINDQDSVINWILSNYGNNYSSKLKDLDQKIQWDKNSKETGLGQKEISDLSLKSNKLFSLNALSVDSASKLLNKVQFSWGSLSKSSNSVLQNADFTDEEISAINSTLKTYAKPGLTNFNEQVDKLVLFNKKYSRKLLKYYVQSKLGVKDEATVKNINKIIDGYEYDDSKSVEANVIGVFDEIKVGENGIISENTKLQSAERNDNEKIINDNLLALVNQFDSIQLTDEQDKTTLQNAREKSSDSEATYKDKKVAYEKLLTLYKKTKGAMDEKESISEEELDQYYENLYWLDRNGYDTDVDTTAMNNLADQLQDTAQASDELSDSLSENENMATRVASAILRYDSALQNILTNGNTWKSTLATGSNVDKSSLLPTLKNVYADLLDLDEAALSNDFLLSSENLNLLTEAAQGVDGAYDSLLEKAKNSIIIEIKAHYAWDDKLWNDFETQVQSRIDSLDVGQIINDENDDLFTAASDLYKSLIECEVPITTIISLFKSLNIEIKYSGDELISIAKATTEQVKWLNKSYETTKSIAEKEKQRLSNQKELNKYLEDERDLYHDINREIAKMNRELSRAQTEQQGLTGIELFNNLTKQSNIQGQTIADLTKKSNLEESDLAKTRTELSSKYGFSFGSDGEITNYLSLVGDAENQVNAARSKKNNLANQMNAWINGGGSTSDEGYIELENLYTQASDEASHIEQWYSDLTSAVSSYDDLLDQHEDTIDAKTEAMRKQIALNIQKFDLEVEIQLDLTTARKNWEDFKRTVINSDDILNPDSFISDIKKVSEAEINYVNRMEDTQLIAGTGGKIEQVLTEINKFNEAARNGTTYESSLFNSISEAYTKLQELQEKGESALKDVVQYADTIKQAYLDTFTYIQDTFDTQNDYYSFISEQLQHDTQLVELIYGARGGRYKDNYYNKINDFNKQQIDMLKKQQEFWAEQEANAIGDQAKKEAHENWENVTQSLNSVTESAIQNLKDQFENMIDTITQELEDSLTNGHGFDYITLEWDILKNHAEMYLDTVNSAFSIKDIQYKFQEAINNTDQLRNQQALKTVMQEQLEILKNKDKLTQYDVDRAQKVLEIEKARIALEEARNNKTSMRLKRDASGNYSYQFTADQQEIDKAQNDLDKAKNDLYNLDLNAWKDNNEKAVAIFKDAMTQIAEIRKNDALTEQQKEERIALIKKDAEEKMTFYAKENISIRSNLQQSAFDSMSDSMTKNEFDFETMIQGMNSESQTFIDKFNSDPDSVMNSFNGAIDTMKTKADQFNGKIEEITTTAGINFDKLKTATDSIIENEEAMLKDNDALIDSMDETITKATDWVTNLSNIETKWNNLKTAATDALTKAEEYIEYWNTHSLGQIRLQNQTGGGGNTSGGGNYNPIGNDNYRNPGTPTATSDKTGPGSSVEDNSDNNEDTWTGGSTRLTRDTAAFKKQLQYLDQNYSSLGLYSNYHNRDIFSQENLKDIREKLLFNLFTMIASAPWALDSNARELYEDLIKRQHYSLNGQGSKEAYEKYPFVMQGLLEAFLKKWSYNGVSGLGSSFISLFDKYMTTDAWKIGKSSLSAFATGGYTGEWGSEGKWALLHEKELVLNKNDTKNMLDIIQTTRDAMAAFKNNSLMSIVQNEVLATISSLNEGLNSYNKNFNNQINKYTTQINNQNNKLKEIEQDVKIEANFPNVSSKKEIEEAFSNLTNLATQKALKYNKN